MSLSTVMMSDIATPGHYAVMRTFLTSTTEQLAAVLARFRSTMRANLPRREGFDYGRRHVPLPVDPSHIPAYLPRRRLPLRFQSRFDARAINHWWECLRRTRSSGAEEAVQLGRRFGR